MLKKLMGANAFGGTASDLSFLFPGDIAAGAETIAALTTAGAGTWTAALMTSGIIRRTGPTAGYTDTTATAVDIINALIAGTNSPSQAGNAVQAGTTFRIRFVNTVAFALTLAAGTGVTLGNDTGCPASVSKDYLVTVLEGTPSAVIVGNLTNGSAVITGVDPIAMQRINVGQAITAASGIPAATTVASINSAAGTVTMSANANATVPSAVCTCSPRVRIDGI